MALDLEPPPARLRGLQLIVSSLIIGVAAFAVVAIVMPTRAGGTGGASIPMMRVVSVLLLVSAVAVSTVLPIAIRRSVAGPDRDTATEAVFQRFMTATLIGCAMLESASLFALIVFWIGGEPVDLVIAAVPLVIMMIGHFPSHARWSRFRGERAS